MTDYINRDKALAFCRPDEHGTPDERWRPESEFFEYIKAIPIADVREVVHGRWIKTNNPNYSPFDNSPEYNAICSNCFHTSEQIFNYCPNCGAKMDKEEIDG